MTRNMQLYKALADLTTKSLAILSAAVLAKPITVEKIAWEKGGGESYVQTTRRTLMWPILWHQTLPSITTTGEYQAFVEAVTSDSKIAAQIDTLVGTSAARSRFEKDRILWHIAKSFLQDTGIKAFDEKEFETVYSKIEEQLYSATITVDRVTPLCGFVANVPEIQLSENVAIVKLSEDEIIDLMENGIQLGSSVFNGTVIHNPHRYALKVRCTAPKIISEKDHEKEVEEIDPCLIGEIEKKVVNALRLFQEGKIYAIGTMTHHTRLFDSGRTYSFGRPLEPFMTNKFQLKDEDVESFVEFWQLKSSITIPEKHFLNVAIRRFSQANERKDSEDKLIDLLISAEALFLSSGDPSQAELKYRLSHRAAMFLGSTVTEQKEIFKFMQKAYVARSRIVHGAEPKLPKKDDGTKYTLPEFCRAVEKLMRDAIKHALKEFSGAGKVKKMIEWLDIVFKEERQVSDE